MRTYQKQPYYFTFGYGHAHPKGYLIINADDWAAARAYMFKLYKDKWAFQYTEDDFHRRCEKYNLDLIKEITI